MSTDRQETPVRCIACGRNGVCVDCSDDWGRFWTEWRGFDMKPAPDHLVLRKRVDPEMPICECGGVEIRSISAS